MKVTMVVCFPHKKQINESSLDSFSVQEQFLVQFFANIDVITKTRHSEAFYDMMLCEFSSLNSQILH